MREHPDWLGGDDDRQALWGPESGTSLTYGVLRERVQLIAGQLVGLGVGVGDVVAYSLPNGPECVVMFLAIVSSGAAAAPLNPAYRSAEVERHILDLRPSLMVVHRSTPKATINAATGSHTTTVELTGNDDDLRLETDAHVGTIPPSDHDAIALLLHTSGTTGRAKVVPLRRRNLTASALAIGSHYALTPADVSHCVMPLFHVHGLVASTLAPLLTGGVVIAPRRFSASAFWDHGNSLGATWYSAVPTIHQILLDRAREAGPSAHQLRFARSCSAALHPSVMESYERTFEIPLVEAYGMTEAAHQMASNLLPPGVRKPGAVGVSAGAQIRIVDDDWVPQPTDEVGEVAVRGEGVIDGYLRNPEANETSFQAGWFRTGDSGTLDADGFLRLRGRIKELINRGGEKISPHEVEAVLLSHPAVVQAVVFGTPDPKYGEAVAAAVVLRDAADGRALQEHCANYLAEFKVPARIAILDDIPKGPTGKIQRRLLPALLDERQ